MTASAVGSYATASALKSLIGITDSTDDTLIALICDRVNQYIESQTKQVIAPIGSATYLYDGNGLAHLFLPTPTNAATKSIGGIRAITKLEIASSTGGSFEEIASTDFFLRDKHGMLGPYRWLRLSDTSSSFSAFPPGIANVRITGTAGWPAIPDDVTDMALSVAHRAWNARQSGQQNLVGADDMARPFVAQYFDPRDRATLKSYTLRPI